MKALGMIEVYGYLAAVEALDSALKAANVTMVDVTLVQGGLVTVLVTGDVGAVKAAMDASRTAAERVGKVISVHVIPRPSERIEKMIPARVVNALPSKEVPETTEPKDTTALIKEDETLERSLGLAIGESDVGKVALSESQEELEQEAEPELKPEAKQQPEAELNSVVDRQPEPESKPEVEQQPEPELQLDVEQQPELKLTPEQLKEMTVERLRSLARELGITNMTRKQIRFATKHELIESISKFIEQER